MAELPADHADPKLITRRRERRTPIALLIFLAGLAAGLAAGGWR